MDLQGYPAVRPELDLVEQEDQWTHEISLEEEIDPEITLGTSCNVKLVLPLWSTYLFILYMWILIISLSFRHIQTGP